MVAHSSTTARYRFGSSSPSDLIFVLALAIILVSALEGTSERASGDYYELSELAFPLTVEPGDQVSFVINDSDQEEYIHVAGPTPGQKTEYWLAINGTDPWKQSAIADIRSVGSGRWNLTFEIGGRISIVRYLPEMCRWTVSSTNLDQVVCQPLNLTRPTAFDLMTWNIDHPYTLRIQGDVDSYFYDTYLRPLGSGHEKTYEKNMMDVIVVVPRNDTAIVTFSLTPATAESSWGLAVVFLSVLVIMTVIVIAVLWSKRRRKDRGDTKGKAKGMSSKRAQT